MNTGSLHEQTAMALYASSDIVIREDFYLLAQIYLRAWFIGACYQKFASGYSRD